MRLKYIDTCSFQRSESTNFRMLAKKNKWNLGKDEVACLVSKTGDQIVFVYGEGVAKNVGLRGVEVEHPVVHSTRLRLDDRRKWTPTMLVNYAEEVGLKLDGLKRFEEYYR